MVLPEGTTVCTRCARTVKGAKPWWILGILLSVLYTGALILLVGSNAMHILLCGGLEGALSPEAAVRKGFSGTYGVDSDRVLNAVPEDFLREMRTTYDQSRSDIGEAVTVYSRDLMTGYLLERDLMVEDQYDVDMTIDRMGGCSDLEKGLVQTIMYSDMDRRTGGFDPGKCTRFVSIQGTVEITAHDREGNTWTLKKDVNDYAFLYKGKWYSYKACMTIVNVLGNA